MTVNAMLIITVPTEDIVDWASFHDVFQERLKFAAYYGRNMNAWIDLMTYLDEPGQVDTLGVDPGVIVGLRLDEGVAFASRMPDIYSALVEGVASVNERRRDLGKPALLEILPSDQLPT